MCPVGDHASNWEDPQQGSHFAYIRPAGRQVCPPIFVIFQCHQDPNTIPYSVHMPAAGPILSDELVRHA